MTHVFMSPAVKLIYFILPIELMMDEFYLVYEMNET